VIFFGVVRDWHAATVRPVPDALEAKTEEGRPPQVHVRVASFARSPASRSVTTLSATRHAAAIAGSGECFAAKVTVSLIARRTSATATERASETPAPDESYAAKAIGGPVVWRMGSSARLRSCGDDHPWR